MKQRILELAIMVIAIILVAVSVKVFGLDITVIVTIGFIIGKIMAMEIKDKLK
jgi:uncharacterized Tic20 family protein